MLESCFCGRSGGLEGCEPVFDDEGTRALRCPDCGHLDLLIWLPEHARLRVFGEAARKSAPSKALTAA
jgi:hypothetical protein